MRCHHISARLTVGKSGSLTLLPALHVGQNSLSASSFRSDIRRKPGCGFHLARTLYTGLSPPTRLHQHLLPYSHTIPFSGEIILPYLSLSVKQFATNGYSLNQGLTSV